MLIVQKFINGRQLICFGTCNMIKNDNSSMQPAPGTVSHLRSKMEAVQNDNKRFQDGSYRSQNGGFRSHDSGFKSQDVSRKSQDGSYSPQDGSYRSQNNSYRTQDGGIRSQDSGYFSQDGANRKPDSSLNIENGGNRGPETVPTSRTRIFTAGGEGLAKRTSTRPQVGSVKQLIARFDQIDE
jgi:hypothetical protein